MREILTIYKFGEFNIKSIYCDQKFKHILQDCAKENNIKLYCTPSQAHMSRAERNIRTIKDRVQSLLYNQPIL